MTEKENKIKKIEGELDVLKKEFEDLRRILLTYYDRWVNIEEKYYNKLEEYQNIKK